MPMEITPHTMLCVLVGLFLSASLTHSSEVFDRRHPDSGLLSWKELQKRAGYFSDGGIWKGGLPKRARNTATVFNTCQEKHANGSFCQTWKSEEERDKTFKRGTCRCASATDSYCKEWSCIQEETERYCQKQYRKQCLAPRKDSFVEDCTCIEAAENERYCRRWMCSENGKRGSAKTGTYFCHAEDASAEFCQSWTGDFTASREVESASCVCGQDADGYCGYWECQTRTLLRCSKHKGGWCDLKISIGVFGGLGLLFLIGGMMMIFADVFSKKAGATLRAKILAVYTCFFVLPWGIGVAIAGGVYGIGWVALMWFVPFLVLGLAVAFSRHERRHESPPLLLPSSEPPQIPAYTYAGKAYS